MRRALSLLVALAMLLAMIPAVYAEAQTLHTVTNRTVTKETPYTWTWTATADGTVHIDATPVYASGVQYTAYEVDIYAKAADYPSGSPVDDGIPLNPGDPWGAPKADFDVTAGQHLVIKLYARKNYADVAGKVNAVITFSSGSGTPQKANLKTDESVVLKQSQQVTLLTDAVWTAYEFKPTATGIYKVSVAAPAQMGAAGFYGNLSVPAAPGLSHEWDCASVGQAIFYAVKSDDPTVNITIERIGDSAGTGEVVYDKYQNQHTPSAALAVAADAWATANKDEMVKLNLTGHSLKLDDNKIYHLDSVDGPVVYVDTVSTIDLTTIYPDPRNTSNTPRTKLLGEYQGKVVEFRDAMLYYIVEDPNETQAAKVKDILCGTQGWYPLTVDLKNCLEGVAARESKDEHSTTNWSAGWEGMCYYVPGTYVPGDLETGDNNNAIPPEGVYSEYVAHEKGTLSLTMKGDNWKYSITKDSQDGTELASSASSAAAPSATAQVSLEKGDKVVLFVAPDSAQQAVEVPFNVAFTHDDTVKDTGCCDENGIPIVDNDPDTSEVITYTTAAHGADQTLYYSLSRGSGMNMTISGTGTFAVTYNGENIPVSDSKAVIEGVNPSSYNPDAIGITGTGVFNILMEFPVGHFGNPDALSLGDNTATVEENTDGYYYIWTAPKDGTLTLIAEGVAVNTNGWSVDANCGFVNQHVDYWSGETADSHPDTVLMEMKAGETVKIGINTCCMTNNGMGKTPAGTVKFNAAFAEAGTAVNPIKLHNQLSGNDYAHTLVTPQPADSTVYYQLMGNIEGKLTVNGTGDFTVTLGRQTVDAVDGVVMIEDVIGYSYEPIILSVENKSGAECAYKFAMTPVLGTWQNPAPLTLGENTVNTYDGFFYEWTAECDGILTIDMLSSNFVLSLGNNDMLYSTDGKTSDSVAVAAGEEVPVIVMPEEASVPVDISFTASFKHDMESESMAVHSAGVKATHTTNGKATVYKCGVCEALLLGNGAVWSGEESDLLILATGHTGADKIAAMGATCVKAGNVANWYCEECGKSFDGESADANEIDPVLPIDKDAHNPEKLEHYEALEVSCHFDGNKESYFCYDCEKYLDADKKIVDVYDLIIKAENELVWVAEKKATTDAEGMKEHWYCSHCDTYYKVDRDGEEKYIGAEVAKADLIIPKTTTPTTGDMSLLRPLIAMAVMGTMGIAVLAILKKKSVA